MSIKEKADELVDHGRETRGEYDPAPGRFPLRATILN